MHRTRTSIAFLISTSTFVFSSARAHGADAGAALPNVDGEVRALEKQIDDDRIALSTSDCQSACRALGSIRRAADRICALEPGPRCDAARSKAQDATRRVREACPDCALTMSPLPGIPRDEERVSAEPPPKAESAVRANAPPSEHGGGCRSCATTGSSRTAPIDVGLLSLGILGAFRALRVKLRNRRRRL